MKVIQEMYVVTHKNNLTKFFCEGRQFTPTFLFTVVSVPSQECERLTCVKGNKFSSICTIYFPINFWRCSEGVVFLCF